MGENGSVFRVAYYEAGERGVARAGATLSRRMEHGGGIWRLELPRPGGERLELEQAGDPAAPPERMAGVLSAFLRGTEPEPVVRLQVARDDGELRAKLLEGLQAGELGTKDGAPEDSVVAVRGGKATSRDPIWRLRIVLERQYARCCATIRACGWTSTRRTSIACGWPCGAPARSCARPARCSTPNGRSPCARS